MRILPQYAEARNLGAITQAYRTDGIAIVLNNNSVRQLDA
jgi:hypothetical protein